MSILWGLIGIIIILTIAVTLSNNKKAINYRTVIAAFGLQVLFALLVLYIPFGQSLLQIMADGVNKAISAGREGIVFVFGPLATGSVGFVFAVSVLGSIVFFASLISVLYYLRIMPFLFNTIGFALHKLLRTSRSESLSATANIFVGYVEAPFVVKPFLNKMTKSQIFSVMVCGLASVSGSVIAGYANLGIDVKYLIAASLMSAPGGLLMSKIIVPETENTIESTKDIETNDLAPTDLPPSNIVEAAARGAGDGLMLALNVGAMLIAIVGLVTLADMIVGGIGSIFGAESLSFSLILGYLFSPLAFAIGIPWAEATQAGMFLGQKLIFNEFVAYMNFSEIMTTFDMKTQVIITFALCGFANFASVGSLIGGLGAIAPNQKSYIANLALKAMVAGTLSNLMSATLAGIFISL